MRTGIAYIDLPVLLVLGMLIAGTVLTAVLRAASWMGLE